MSGGFPYALFVEGQWDPNTPKLKNKFTIYFQSRKSGGGDCSVEIPQAAESAVIVRFRTEEVRQNVLTKINHELQLGQKVVKLNLTLPPDEEEEFKQESPIKTEQKDAEIMAVKRTSEASAVLELKKPRLFGTKSQEESPGKSQSPPADKAQEEEQDEDNADMSKRSAVLKNIQNLSQEFLGMLVENVFKGDPKEFSIEVITEINSAVITFTSRKFAVEFILSSPNNSIFKKKNLDVRPLEKTAKVKAEGLPPNTSSDYVLLYFEKFGEIVDEVEMLEEEQSALVTFVDPTVVNTVLTAQHTLKRLPIRVFPYYDSLATALYGKDRPTVYLPEAFTENIDRSIWKYLQEHRTSLDRLKNEMSPHFCKLDLQDHAVRISPLPSLLQQGAQTRKMVQSWKEKASAEFTAALSKYKSQVVTIQSDAWTESESEIQMLQGGSVTLVCHKEEGTVIIAGLVEDVRITTEVLQSFVSRITQRIQREKGSMTDEVAMDPTIYEIVLLSGLDQELSRTFPELELKYSIHSQKLILYGLKHEVLESKNKILEGCIGLHKKVAELHPSIVEFLDKGNVQELSREMFLNKGISASLEIVDNKAMILAKADKTVKDSEHKLKSMLHHELLDLDDPTVLTRAEWQNLVNNLDNTFNSPVKTVLIKTSGNRVAISGFTNEVQLAHEQLSDYVYENSQITETLEADKIVINFFQEHRKQDWFDKVKNKVNVNFEESSVSLRGPRIHILQSVTDFSGLFSSVCLFNLKIPKPGAKKFFKSKESMLVAVALKETNCLIELVDEGEDFGVVAPKKGVTTSHGVEIIVSKGDMCSYSGDAVVNAANENLVLDQGLSKALSLTAGPELQAACKDIISRRGKIATGDAVVTKASGQLRCKHIIHAVGPQFNSSNTQKSCELLRSAVKKCLALADSENCHSLAIPAISSGNLGFPLDLCTNTIVGALKESFEFYSGNTCLKKIHFIDNNEKTVQALQSAVQNVFGDKPKPKFKGGLSKQQQNPIWTNSSSQGSPTSVKTSEGLTITLSKCNIQDTKMDVVVNSISADLNLNHGAIPKSLLNAAGAQLQTLLNQQATGNAKVGDLFITTGCNLKNKLVFHAVAPHWSGQPAEQKALEGIVEKCLNQAEQQNQGSIVFPAIGTGNLGFPKNLVASLMLDSVLKFSKKRSSKNVQEVVVALHPTDTQTIQAFSDEFNKRFSIQPTSSSASTQQAKGIFSSVTSPKSGVYEATLNGVVIQVLSGDITKETADVIVNSSNENFTLKAGVSKAVLDAAGPNVEAECQQLGSQQNTGLITTQPGNLRCKKIIHISAKNHPPTIYKRVKEALKLTAQQNFTSISFPAFGTGQGGVNAGQVADSMLDAVGDFVTKNPQSSVKAVHIVIFQAPMLADFHQSMLRRDSSSKPKKDMSFYSKITALAKSLFSNSDKEVQQDKGKDFVIEGKVVDPACFNICGLSQSDVDKAKKWIERTITDEQAFETIVDPAILSLADKDYQRIQDLQDEMDVTVRVEYKSQAAQSGGSGEATLAVEGLIRDVLKAVSEIQSILKKTREGMVLKKEIDILSGLVEWQYEQGGRYQSFDPVTNYNLEQALTSGSAHVDIDFQGRSYRVSLPEGPAVSGGTQMKIKRIDKTDTDSLPQEWEPMPSGQLFKVCPLQPNSSEYKDVLQQFRKTCKNNVISIDRIQNPGMWKKYQYNKEIMESKNKHKNNERKLFHGTREDSMAHINQSGFNRSFAGLNAAAFGRGTYFAVNANYSASNTYSVPNQQGQKRMYLCSVLTGDYTAGNSAMVVPPAKAGSSVDLYDTVVDNVSAPSMFVVFRDDQAYPDYLITFT